MENRKKNIAVWLWHSIKCNENVRCDVKLDSNRAVGFFFFTSRSAQLISMPSAGGDITIIIKNRHEIPVIQMYPCSGLKMLHSRAESGHDFLSAGE